MFFFFFCFCMNSDSIRSTVTWEKWPTRTMPLPVVVLQWLTRYLGDIKFKKNADLCQHTGSVKEYFFHTAQMCLWILQSCCENWDGSAFTWNWMRMHSNVCFLKLCCQMSPIWSLCDTLLKPVANPRNGMKNGVSLITYSNYLNCFSVTIWSFHVAYSDTFV